MSASCMDNSIPLAQKRQYSDFPLPFRGLFSVNFFRKKFCCKILHKLNLGLKGAKMNILI